MKKIATTTERAGSPAVPKWGLTGGVLITLAGLLALLGFAGPAVASSSYPPAPTCSVAGSSNGSSTSVTGTGFQPGSLVTISLGGSQGSVTTNSSGSFATTIGAAGGTLSATGGGCTARAAVAAARAETGATVPVNRSSGGALPNTGADVLGVAAIAGLMLIGGALLLVQGRRRHS